MLWRFLNAHRKVWHYLPDWAPVRVYGRLVHWLARTRSNRVQGYYTFFLRNRPQLELIRVLSIRNDPVRIAILGCSIGAEVYSVAAQLQRRRRILSAVDMSPLAIDAAKAALYPQRLQIDDNEFDILERVNEREREELFEDYGTLTRVKPGLRRGIHWYVGDAAEPLIHEALGGQDIVVANNFLFHMDPGRQRECLRRIAGLVRPGGCLVVSGVDLDVKTEVARERRWQPVDYLLEEIHEGDCSLRGHWPWHYVGLEPLNKHRRDWLTRYATTYELPELV